MWSEPCTEGCERSGLGTEGSRRSGAHPAWALRSTLFPAGQAQLPWGLGICRETLLYLIPQTLSGHHGNVPTFLGDGETPVSGNPSPSNQVLPFSKESNRFCNKVVGEISLLIPSPVGRGGPSASLLTVPPPLALPLATALHTSSA